VADGARLDVDWVGALCVAYDDRIGGHAYYQITSLTPAR
jgi:hypothetical protein